MPKEVVLLDGDTRHNHNKKIAQLIKEGAFSNLQSGAHCLRVFHDDWCAINKGKFCNCNPDIVLGEYRPMGEA